MSDNEIGLGPVDYLIVEWPAGTEPNGKGLDLLTGYTEQGLIRVLDLVFVQKQDDGTLEGLALADIDGDGDGELDEASAALAPGASAAILLYENRSAAPFAAAVRAGGAELVARGGIPVDAIVETLDTLDAAQV
jgi:hypothetical protein